MPHNGLKINRNAEIFHPKNLNSDINLKILMPVVVVSLQGHSQPHSPGWARVPLSSFFLKFLSIIIFPQIFVLILALRVGDSPTQEGPGYATVSLTQQTMSCCMLHLFLTNVYHLRVHVSMQYRGCVFNHRLTWNKGIEQACYPITKTIQNNTVLEPWTPFLYITLSPRDSLLLITLNKV